MTADDVEIIGTEELYRGYMRLDRLTLRHRLFGGGWSGAFTREVLERGHAVGVLLYDTGRDEVVLVEQFRVGAHLAGRPAWQVEMVCGVIGPGESAEEVARREAAEEAGCEVLDLLPVCEVLLSPGVLTETCAIWCGRVDAAGAGGLHGLADEHEDIRSFVLPLDEALARVRDGRVLHAPTVVALQWLALNRETVKSAWSAS